MEHKASDTRHVKKNYYRLVHHSAREKIDVSKNHFKSLVLRLLGDRDQETVLDIEAKVAKQFSKEVEPYAS